MYRQGAWGRGIVARGVVRSLPWRAPHWDEGGGTTNHVDVEWQEAVPTDVALELEDLETLAPEFAWRQVYASGRQLPAPVGAAVAREWAEHLRACSPPDPDGAPSGSS
jgi:hypothetical protein